MLDANLVPLIAIIFSIIGLVLIGGMALFCFTKAFGVVFLGQARTPMHHEIKEAPLLQRLPLYLIAAIIILIGIVPQGFIRMLESPVALFTGRVQPGFIPFSEGSVDVLPTLGLVSGLLLVLVLLLYLLRKGATQKRQVSVSSTWGCGYVAPTARQQYTASSFVRTYSKLFNMVLLFEKREKTVTGIFPAEAGFKSHAYDRIERGLVDRPIRAYKRFLSHLLFLNNGRLQFSILYGIIFIISVICIPMLYHIVVDFIEFLKLL